MLRTFFMRGCVATSLLAVSSSVIFFAPRLRARELSSSEWQDDTAASCTESIGCDGYGIDGAVDGYAGSADYCGAYNPHWCGLPAPSYPVPFATPRVVGYTNFTYPPLMPHHSLPHYRHVYSFRHGPGLSRTNVHWHKSYLHSTLDWVHHVFELPR